eukprot:3095402-Heterocapsa_arctica.AAC.1
MPDSRSRWFIGRLRKARATGAPPLPTMGGTGKKNAALRKEDVLLQHRQKNFFHFPKRGTLDALSKANIGQCPADTPRLPHSPQIGII